MHSIEYDPIHDEIVAPQPFGQAILIFRGGAAGEEAPIRIIQGPRTRLAYTFADAKLGLDPVNGEIYIPQGDELLVFRRESQGDVAPIRTLRGPNTQLGARSVAVDAVHNLLIVTGSRGNEFGGGGQILIFDRTAEGNTKPRAVISGSRTGLRSPGGLRVHAQRGWIVLTDSGGGGRASDASHVAVWSIHDNGDVPPRWTIAGPNGMLKQPRGLALDAANKNIIVSDKFLNAVLTYSFPELFAK